MPDATAEPACPTCGGKVPPKGATGPRSTYCSKACRRVAAKPGARARRQLLAERERASRPKATCVVCAAEFVPLQARSVCCSPRCIKARWRGLFVQTRTCSTTGCSRPLRAKGLCNPCYRRARREAGIPEKPQPWNDARRDSYHRRRALKKGASTGEPVELAQIATRDAWRCHLCHRKVKVSTPWPHPLSPSLDHVIPLTKGGAHDPSNVRLAHLRCNTAKGNREVGEQLLLIG